MMLASIVAGLVLAGTPGEERSRQYDERRVSSLEELRFAVVDRYYGSYGHLPDTLADAQKAIGYPDQSV